MITKEYVIPCASGLHARPASELVQMTQELESEVTLHHLGNGEIADAKSIIEVLSLGADKGDTIKIEADGDDEEAAVERIIDLLDHVEE
ncbi:MAG: HPr family phosphocarrier protein [Eubacteriaceae bacterium]|nr:HPr family phosphocarrier protein [Eubacteriaceae bacterium]